MGETEDPRTALNASDLPTQAAAARDLALCGGWADVEGLLQVAATHKRLGMRLAAIGAVADILHRLATGARRAADTMDHDRVSRVLDWVKDQDPGTNPSLLMVLAHLGDDRATDRLVRLLRDPRADVRAGAMVTLRRMALSSLAIEAERPQADVARCLVDRRFPADIVADLIRLVGEAGWSSLRSTLVALDPPGAARDVVQEAVRRLDQRVDPDGWSGVYTSDGLDVLEQDHAPRAPSTLLLYGGSLALDDGPAQPLRLSGGRLAGLDGAARLIWAPRVGRPERRPAVQDGGRTWHRLEGKALVEAVEDGSLRFGLAARPASGALYAALSAEEGAGADRARAIALCQEGRWSEGRAALLAHVEGKKARWELYPWLARAAEALGDPAGARAAWWMVLERAPRRSPIRAEAEARVAELQLAGIAATPAHDEGET